MIRVPHNRRARITHVWGAWIALSAAAGCALSLASATSAQVPVLAAAEPVAPEKPRPEADSPPANARARDAIPLIDLNRTETDNLRLLYFDPAQTYLTPYVGRSFENAHTLLRREFGWRPWDKTTLLLKDFSDYGNAAARAAPNNAVLIDVAPLSLAYETFSPGERFYTLTNHELTHVALMDGWNKRDARWRRLLMGKPMPEQDHPESILYNYLATPRVNVPRWHLEGAAVFMETWMAGGLGRAQGAYDEMVFRAMVRDDARFYSPVGLASEGGHVDFQVGVNDYLYGTRFISYLALNYSPEKVVDWLRRDDGDAAYYSTHFKNVFGLPLTQAWNAWIDWERGFQRTNLDSVRALPLTPSEPLADVGLGSVSRSFIEPRTGDLLGAFKFPGVLPHVGVLSPETGMIRRLTDIKGSMLYRVTSLAYDEATNTAWYTTDNYAYRDVMEIDVATGRKRMVLRDKRIGDLAFNPADRSLWGLRHLNGMVTLVRMPAPHESFNNLFTFPVDTTAFDLDISPDGKLLSAVVSQADGRQSVQVFLVKDLLDGDATPIETFNVDGAAPEGFVFAPDGRHLYGTSYYSGVSNVFRFDLATRELVAVTNTDGGYFRPIPQADGSLVVFEFAGDGFRPVRIQPTPIDPDDLPATRFLGNEIYKAHPVVKQWAAGSPKSVPFEDMITARGKYRPRDEMRLAAAYPVVEGYRGRAAAGYHVIVEDPLQFHRLRGTVSYSQSQSLEDQDWHVDLEYQTLRWNVRFRHNDADFYDLFGPTERSRKGDVLSVGYRRSIVYDPPRKLEVTVDAAHYTGLDTLPTAQAVDAQFDTLTTAQAGLAYSNTTKSLGAVDHEKGVEWSLNIGADRANDEVFARVDAGFNAGVPLPIKNASAWIYTAAGVTDGDADSPLASSYLGGFGNNFVDDREVKRYRETQSFPGFEINEIEAQTFVKAVGEINLPPVRFRDVGTPALYLSSARTAVFVGALATESAAGVSREFQTVGAQIDFNFTAAHRLPMVLSLGYAEGYEDGDRRGSEVMLSLKIM